ncbi:MAG: hypothetical protein HQK73_10770 [Desulfamplus sp.]|nr:hypothetical protein [Desulfamplus sp.]
MILTHNRIIVKIKMPKIKGFCFIPPYKSVKYLITNELTWEITMIISVYSYRWVIEKFFRNAKQLSDMEGATIFSPLLLTL